MSALHPRTVIRKGVAALLKGKTAAGQSVYTSRVEAFGSRHLPAISIYTTDEDADHNDTSPRRYTRTPDVVVQAVFEVDANLDDAMDAMALEIEAVLLPDPSWGGIVDDSVLTKTAMYLAETGRTELGCLALTFRAEYDTRPGLVAEATQNDFAKGGVTFAPASPKGAPESTDIIILPTQPTE